MTIKEKASFFRNDKSDYDIYTPEVYIAAIENTMSQYLCKWELIPWSTLDNGETIFKVSCFRDSTCLGQCKSPNLEIAVVETLAQVFDSLKII